MKSSETPAPAGEEKCVYCHHPGARWQMIKMNGEKVPVHLRCVPTPRSRGVRRRLGRPGP